MEYLKVFATVKEIDRVRKAQGRPLIAMTNPAPPGPGVPHAIPMFQSPVEVAHQAALSHGLPEFPGHYGVDMRTGEFIKP